jgi:hypothetical protein
MNKDTPDLENMMWALEDKCWVCGEQSPLHKWNCPKSHVHGEIKKILECIKNDDYDALKE